MHLSRFCLVFLLCSVAAAGCIFSPNIQDGFYECKLQSDCPTGMVCSAILGGCIKSAGPVDGGPQTPCSSQGATRVCYSGADGTAGVGSCRPGTQTCEGGFWSPCQGELLPAQESCNGKDDDCNGQVDDGCPCQEGSQRNCYPGPQGTLNQGSCVAGTQSCVNQKWGPCENFVAPQPEICDGQDNDCNGQIDDTPPRRCYTGPPPTLGVGRCKAGTQTCQSGRWGTCVGEVLPSPTEQCNNRQDDDCDGQVDESCGNCTPGTSQACYGGPADTRGKGVCREGRQQCDANGNFGPCVGQVLPSIEQCNGRDDDCDGTVDEQIVPVACYTGPAGTQDKGICRSGSRSCVRGQLGPCVGQILPQIENCDNVDNDCDGTIDEGCECTTGATRSCYNGPAQTKGVGACKEGVQTCSAQRQWGACQGEVGPKKEECNGIDDDCDGNVDGFSERCYTGPAGTEGKGTCRAGARTCKEGKWSSCQGEIKPTTEICDGKDNDCDGQIDESLKRACFNAANGCTKQADGSFKCQGNCQSGTETCLNGSWSKCVGEVVPSTETCNKQDDDCDGKVDGYQEDCYTATDKGCTPDGKGGFRCKGSCATGKRQCSNGNLSICIGQVNVQPEACDGKDNNCDGQIDEGCQCIAGTTRDCYSGPTGTEGKGLCKKGTQKCDQFGQLGPCVGEVTPAKETCNGKDDDCDGAIDGMTQRCYTGPAATRNKAPCREGIQTCTNGTFGACQGEIVPKTETCNGVDDDCNGKIDDNLAAPKCPKQKGVCTGAVQRCGGAAGWLACSVADYGADYQLIETKCDGKDNDCDGAVDGVGACGKCLFSTEAAKFVATLPKSCAATNKCYDGCLYYQGSNYYCRNTSAKGYAYVTYASWLTTCSTKAICETSTCGGRNFFCDGTRWREGTKPGTNDDFCDGLDNNCNGKVDENCTCQSPCTADKYCTGPCTKCVQQAGSPFPTCSP